MPAGLIPNEGLTAQIDMLLRDVIPDVFPWELMLWTNDIVPGPNTVLAMLTEATFGGYSRATLDRDLWTAPVVNAGCAHSTWGTDPVVWTVTAGPLETIRGLAYVDATINKLMFAQRFDAADIRAVTIGGKVQLLPEYTFTTGAC